MSFFKISPNVQFKVLLKLCVLGALILPMSACDLTENYTKVDRASDMAFQDFRDGLADRMGEMNEDDDDNEAAAKMAAIPDLQPYLSMGDDAAEPMPLVSVSVNGTVSLRDVLYELARQAEYDLELDPNITGSIIFTAREKPFDLVVERISKVAGLRYKFEDSFLRVELDTPYNKTYKIDYLNFIRSNSGSVNTSVSVVSGDGADTGSSYSTSSEGVSDFWGELDVNLAQILAGAQSAGLKTSIDPVVRAAPQNNTTQVAAPLPVEGDGGQTVTVQPPEAVLNVEALPSGPATAGNSSPQTANAASFSINKQAGIISVYAAEKAHKEVREYLDEVRRSVTAQVLVEAKVFEVTLNDEYINGIEWDSVLVNDRLGAGFYNANDSNYLTGTISSLAGNVAEDSVFAVGFDFGDFGGLLQAVSGYGTVRALASPRLTVLNNQSAALNVATNKVFFDIDLTEEEDEDTGDTTLEIESEAQTVPEGILINVQPSIDLDKRTISMFVRPTVTSITGVVQDPGVQLIAGASGIQSEVPEVNVQEIDTVVKVHSGQAIVMGGLMQDRITVSEEGVPVLSEIPLLGTAFRSHRDLVSKTELVIFLKATLIDNSEETIHNVDRDLYRKFSGDRRPFDL